VPVTLFFSNRLEALADKLLDMIDRRGGGGEDPLQAPKVVIPNTNLARWLKLIIACRRSICMNIAFEFLDRGLWRMLAALDSDSTAAAPLENEELQVLLLSALQQMPKDDQQLRPLRRYLEGPSGRGSAGHAARLWQLAETLARLFSEYELHRAEMIARWRRAAPATDPLEACQQRLYLYIRELARTVSESKPGRLFSLSEYAQQVFASAWQPVEKPRGVVHFFGLSQISSMHLEIFQRLSSHYEMFIYVMNPCREFWEDVFTPSEQRWLRRKNERRLRILPEEEAEGELQQPADHELLAAWGKPGRESIRRFCALANYDFIENYIAETPPDNVLKALQHDILTLGGEDRRRVSLAQDVSLQIGACPGITREVETVYNSILSNLQRDESLRLTDIAVLVPAMDTYKPVLEAVFGRYPSVISYNLADARAREQSLYGQAVLKLLELSRGRFSRREVFDLLLNPCVMHKWGLAAGDVHTWALWASQLNIFHCFDDRDKRARGYPDDPGHTWQQGLLRLRLSRVLLDSARLPSDSPGSFPHFRGIVPFGDVAGSDPQLLETFCLLMETLHRGVQQLKSLRAGGLRWRDVLSGVCDELLQPPRNSPGEEVVRQELMKALGRYGRLAGESEKARLDIELVIELVKSRLGGIPGGKGEYLTGGVTISALQPMRPIPFRIIYVLGLQEGSFPGRAPQSSLDLQLVRRRIGDVSLPERNRYLFLETLLSARERLYLTYVSRDLQKDREIMPGSVIRQLCRCLENRILPPEATFAITRVPLKGSDPLYTRPDPVPENGDLLANFSWGDRMSFYHSQGLWDQARQRCPEAMRAELDRFCPDLTAAAVSDGEEPGGVAQVTFRHLQRFLEDPAAFAMQRHLGFYQEEPEVEELAEEEDEPFFTPFPADYRLITDPLTWWLENALDPKGDPGLEPEALFEQYYDHLSRQGMTPEAVYADLDRRALRNQVIERAGLLQDVLGSMRRAACFYRSVVIGEPCLERTVIPHRLAASRFDALELGLPEGLLSTSAVRLHGERQWLWRSGDGSWHTLVITGSGSTAKRPARYVIQPVLFYLAGLAHRQIRPWLGEGLFHVHVAFRTRLRRFVYSFDEQTARKYLATLAAEALNDGDIVWLPFDIAGRREKILTAPAEEVTDMERSAFEAFLLEAFDRADAEYLLRLVKPEIDSHALDCARRRLGLFFNTLERE